MQNKKKVIETVIETIEAILKDKKTIMIIILAMILSKKLNNHQNKISKRTKEHQEEGIETETIKMILLNNRKINNKIKNKLVQKTLDLEKEDKNKKFKIIIYQHLKDLQIIIKMVLLNQRNNHKTNNKTNNKILPRTLDLKYDKGEKNENLKIMIYQHSKDLQIIIKINKIINNLLDNNKLKVLMIFQQLEVLDLAELLKKIWVMDGQKEIEILNSQIV